MNTNQKTRLKAEDMEWNVLKTLGLSKEQLEADGSMERLLQGMETEAIPFEVPYPGHRPEHGRHMRLVPGPVENRSWKSRESARKRNRSIRRKKSDT